MILAVWFIALVPFPSARHKRVVIILNRIRLFVKRFGALCDGGAVRTKAVVAPTQYQNAGSTPGARGDFVRARVV